jgi:hypothetical protein
MGFKLRVLGWTIPPQPDLRFIYPIYFKGIGVPETILKGNLRKKIQYILIINSKKMK